MPLLHILFTVPVILAFGSFWFYAALIIPFFILVAFVENERSSGAFWTILLTVALFSLFGNHGTWPWIIHHPTLDAIGIGAYVILGIAWGFVKWGFFVLRARDKYEDYRKSWVALHGEIDDTPMPLSAQETRNGAKPYTKRASFLRDVERLDYKPPSADTNKGRIIFWMSYWPASAFWTILNDPLRRIFDFVYRRLGAIFQHMSNAMYGKFKDDFVVKEEVKLPEGGSIFEPEVPPLGKSGQTGR